MTKYAVKLSDEKEKRAGREREASFIGDRQSHCPVFFLPPVGSA